MSVEHRIEVFKHKAYLALEKLLQREAVDGVIRDLFLRHPTSEVTH